MVTLTSSATLPSPNASIAGLIMRAPGADGVPDTVYVCLKTTADNYRWQKWFDGDGKLYVGTMDALPAAGPDWHNAIVTIPGPPDISYICLQATNNAYFWRQMLDGDGGCDRSSMTGI